MAQRLRHVVMRWSPAAACLLIAVAGPAQGDGSFLASCPYDHSLADDPIILPASPGASHLHDFFGARTASAFSTLDALRAGGTSCALAGDTAAYWAPALYRDGVKIDPVGAGPTRVKVRMRVYYNRSNLASGTAVEILPPDLRIVAGNSHATSPAENPKLGREIYWGCSDNSVSGKPTAPPASCPTGIISLHIGFPNCWDGVLTHANDTAHLVYPSSGRCPLTHPHILPRVIMRLEYPVGIPTGDVVLSSGPPYTAHGDFWNGWDPLVLADKIATCINGNVSCGVLR